jgi:hypothetical protein
MAFALLFMGNSSGPAANGNYYTGAPTTGGGTERTCSTCHNSGNFGEPQLNVSFAAPGESGAALTSYVPGQTYTVTVAVGYLSTEPAGFGFQSQFLLAGDNTTAGDLAMPAAGTQITAAPGSRRYAEHSRVSADSTFTFEWTAPMAGSGDVQVYVVGNLVNRAGGNSGDNGSTAPTIVSLSEGNPVATRNFELIEGALFPNPTSGPTTLRVTPPRGGEYSLRILGMNGQVLTQGDHQLVAGTSTIQLPVETLSSGMYLIELQGEGARLVTKLIRE